MFTIDQDELNGLPAYKKKLFIFFIYTNLLVKVSKTFLMIHAKNMFNTYLQINTISIGADWPVIFILVFGPFKTFSIFVDVILIFNNK